MALTDTQRSAILTEARRWIGTPYRHQSAQRGHGCDCLGFIRGLWRALYGAEPETPPAYTMDWSETTGEEALWAAASRHLAPARIAFTQNALSDVLLFRMRRGAVAKHLGILAWDARLGGPSLIHAYSGHHVIEAPLSLPWQRRIVAQFSFPPAPFTQKG